MTGHPSSAPVATATESPRRENNPAAPAFVGWFNTVPESGGAVPLVRDDERSGAKSIDAPSVRISFDPDRVQYHVDENTILLYCGAPRFGDRGGARPHELAREIQRHADARGDIRGEINWTWLRGRFAIVHIDLGAGSIALVTDRFGVDPICYSHDDDRLCFSDRADGVPLRQARRIDPQAIFNYVYFHVIPAPRTVFRGVQRVEPAQAVRVDATGLHSTFWWQPQFAPARGASMPAMQAQFRELLQRAVEREATTERIGSFLSGGTDSSTIAGFLGKVSGRQAATFSIGFDATGYDEMAYARIAARHYGTKQHEYYVTPDDLVRSIPAVAAFYDQPFGNSSSLPAFYCALRAREAGVEKMLAGDGGDELFGGNTRYAKQKVFDAYGNVPGLLRTGLLEPLLLGMDWPRRVPLLKKAASYIEQARVPMPDRMETYNLLERFGPAAVFTPAFLLQVHGSEPRALQRAVYAQVQPPSIVDRMLAYDWRFTLADNDLPKVTGTTRLAGEAVGFPFLDDDLVDFSTRLAPALKVRGLTLRYFFKEALRGFLPDEIIRKRKHGFGLPFGPWLGRSEALRALAHAALDRLAARGIIQPELVRELFSARLSEHAGYFGEMIWILMMLEHWLAAKAPEYTIN